MSTYITYTIDDLDAEIKAGNDRYANRSDYITLRNRAYRKALSEYALGLRNANDTFIRADNFASPITLGTAKITTTGALIFQITLPAGAAYLAEDSILVQKTATTEFFSVPRMAWTDIVVSGTGQTEYAFWENNGVVNIYVKASDFDATASAVFDYFRDPDATQTTGTVLDIKDSDFEQMVDSTSAFLSTYL